MKFFTNFLVNSLIKIVPIELSIESKISLFASTVFVAVFFLSKKIPPILKKYGFLYIDLFVFAKTAKS